MNYIKSQLKKRKLNADIYNDEWKIRSKYYISDNAKIDISKLNLLGAHQFINAGLGIHLAKNILKDAFKQQEHLLKKEKALIVVSENGIDSGGAGVELKKLGIEKVYLRKHGLLSWQEESLPLVK